VYKAKDTRLDRAIALKISKTEFRCRRLPMLRLPLREHPIFEAVEGAASYVQETVTPACQSPCESHNP